MLGSTLRKRRVLHLALRLISGNMDIAPDEYELLGFDLCSLRERGPPGYDAIVERAIDIITEAIVPDE